MSISFLEIFQKKIIFFAFDEKNMDILDFYGKKSVLKAKNKTVLKNSALNFFSFFPIRIIGTFKCGRFKSIRLF